MTGRKRHASLPENFPRLGAARQPGPGNVDAIEGVLGGFVAGDGLEVAFLGTPALGRTHALAAVLAAAHARDFAVRIPDFRRIPAEIHLDAIRQLRRFALL